MKPIHVELAHEGCIVVVLEELGNQGLGEFILIQNNERIALLGPSDKVLVFPLLKKTALSLGYSMPETWRILLTC